MNSTPNELTLLTTLKNGIPSPITTYIQNKQDWRVKYESIMYSLID